RMSMMGHRARIMDSKTFRVHLCTTTPYNADFDGDEMNLHVPQTEEAVAEIKTLMSVNKHIRTPRYGLPIIGAKQDHLMGIYFLTQDRVTLDRKDVSNIAFILGVDVELGKDTYTGKEVFSMLLLPPDLNYKGKTKTGEDVLIENGLLKKGHIDVKSVGAEHGGLLNKIDLIYGNDAGSVFLNKLVRLSLLFLTSNNYTISINDYNIDAEGSKEIDKIVKNRLNKYVKSEGGEEEQIGLEKILTEVEAIIREYFPKDSYSRVAAETGARGNMVSIAQIIGCLGQEKLKGARITRGYYGRTLPFFRVNDVNPSAYGFVRNGYRRGLTPIEFFFDAMHGREGLSDTALKTKHSGYLERRLVNSLHDIIIKPDGTVRNESNQIVQFVPFENNINPYTTNKGKVEMEDLL
ncbi:MAG: DNA-directed RNA polymerase subunit A', partial [Candidatus Aenigmatarchaeota archaeon]